MFNETQPTSLNLKQEFLGQDNYVSNSHNAKRVVYSKVPAFCKLTSDNSSLLSQLPKAKTETVQTEESSIREKLNNILEKISKIYDKLTNEENFLKDLDKTKILRTIAGILNGIPSEEFNISEIELTERIKRVLVLEAVSGTLNKLTSEQIKEFDEAIKRRTFFK